MLQFLTILCSIWNTHILYFTFDENVGLMLICMIPV